MLCLIALLLLVSIPGFLIVKEWKQFKSNHGTRGRNDDFVMVGEKRLLYSTQTLILHLSLSPFYSLFAKFPLEHHFSVPSPEDICSLLM
jgi:hypothetical protein